MKRKRDLAERYGRVTVRTIERWMEEGRIPKPDFYMGRIPLWSDETLDENDRAAAARPRPTQAA